MLETIILDIIAFFFLYSIFALSLNFLQGYTGITYLGIYFPITAGALVAAYLPGRLAMIIFGIDSKLDFVVNNAKVLPLLQARLQYEPLISIFLLAVTIIITVGFCSLLGYLSTYPALRLPATYLAVFTLGLGESLRIIGMQTDWIAGGVFGVSTIDLFWWLGDYAHLGCVTFIIGVSIIIFVIYNSICNSPFGRLLKAIRENEVTAECIGKDIATVKKKAMSFSFVISGIGGVLHALGMGAVIAGGYTRIDFSYWPWIMMIIGGQGNNLGVFLGTFVLVLMRRFMIISKHYFTFLPFEVVWLEPILLAFMLMLTLLFRPCGILPERPSRIGGSMRGDKEEV